MKCLSLSYPQAGPCCEEGPKVHKRIQNCTTLLVNIVLGLTLNNMMIEV